MNSPYVALVCFLCVVMVLIMPVCANPIELILTKITIYQNDVPVDDVANISVNCFGSYKNPAKEAEFLNQKITSDPELIYSYSVTCHPASCTIWSYGYHPTSIMNINSCDLEGNYNEHPFVIKNFTTDPEPVCFFPEKWNFDGNTRYYALSDQDLHYCEEKKQKDLKNQCEKFVKPIEAGQHPKNLYTFANGTMFNRTPEYDTCWKRIEWEQPVCFEAHTRKINQTEITQSHPAGPSLYCESRFDIPSDNFSSVRKSVSIGSSTPQSPVASLYCSILSIFGAKC